MKNIFCYSGIKYIYTNDPSLLFQPMIDNPNPFSVLNQFDHACLSFWERVVLTNRVIMGKHFDWYLTGSGCKGLLDLLIFPLVSRILLYHMALEQNEIFELTVINTQNNMTEKEFMAQYGSWRRPLLIGSDQSNEFFLWACQGSDQWSLKKISRQSNQILSEFFASQMDAGSFKTKWILVDEDRLNLAGCHNPPKMHSIPFAALVILAIFLEGLRRVISILLTLMILPLIGFVHLTFKAVNAMRIEKNASRASGLFRSATGVVDEVINDLNNNSSQSQKVSIVTGVRCF